MKRFFLFSLVLSLLIMTASGAWAANNKPVKMIGAAVLSGKIGALTETGWGLMDGAAFVNLKGGVNGRKFEVLLEDGQYNIPLSVSIFNRVTADQPRDELFFHSGWQTGVLHSIAQKVKENHVVCVDGSMSPAIFTDEVKTKYPYYFSVGVSYGKQTGALVKFIADNLHKGSGKPKLAFIYIESGVGREPIAELRMYCKKFGVDLVLVDPVTFTQTDYTPTLMKVRRSKADYAILWSWSVPVSTRFFKMARKVIPKVELLSMSYAAWEILFYTAKEDFDGVYSFSPYPRPNEKTNPLVATIWDIAKVQKHEKIKIWDLYLQGFLMSMMNGQAAIRADKAGNLSREGCREALEKMTDWDAFGMYNGLTLDYSKHVFNRGRILKADFKTKSLIPATDWLLMEDYLK
ncbi:MAG: ABC transporter substrate-binding protein [Thermodesulfobacteriota bacterium]|nr:ABC transporter substrate-binding protein [Thermodesulfobacteriota bacterium]